MSKQGIQERPILFSAAMVRALLDGRKTQTRRVVKPQPKCDAPPDWPRCKKFNPSFDSDGSVHCANCGHGMRLTRNGAAGIRCPYGKAGDWLWVRETWHHGLPVGVTVAAEEYRQPLYVDYRADMAHELHLLWKWKPSIFMPRWASRITLEITEVRIQQLKDISEEDAAAEGISTSVVDPSPRGVAPIYPKQYGSNIDVYRDLWESIHGAGSWDANPWVWALTFKAVAHA